MSDSQSALNAHNDGKYLPANLLSLTRDTDRPTARRSAPGQKRPDLTWDDGLANDAKQYAQHLADTKKFEHSGVNGQGENLFMSSGNASLADATRAWLNEKPNYHGEKIPDGDFGSYGHYTQVCLTTANTLLNNQTNHPFVTSASGRPLPRSASHWPRHRMARLISSAGIPHQGTGWARMLTAPIILP